MKTSTGCVRPATAADIPAIADLYATVFRTPSPDERLTSALQCVFFGHPWVDDRLPSLVCDTGNGTIVGCLGIMPRPMTMDGRPIRAAVSHTFMVHPGERATLAAVELIRRFLSSGQDVSLAQSLDVSRRILEGIGGSTSLLHSMGWVRVLRPSRYVLSFLTRRGLSRRMSAVLTPIGRAVDSLTNRHIPNPFRIATSALDASELDPTTWMESLAVCSADRSLRPVYDLSSLTWLLRLLGDHNPADRTVIKTALRDSSGQIAGAYLYYGTHTGVADVIQVLARPKTRGEVLDHLICDAYRRGFVSVSGQLDPLLLPALGERHCLFNRGDTSWMLVHSRHPEVLNAIHRGDALLSRAEAEWWISMTLMGSLSPGEADPVAMRRSPTDYGIESRAQTDTIHAVYRH